VDDILHYALYPGRAHVLQPSIGPQT
jgi:hypothetical protein